MPLPKKFFHDKVVLFILTINIFLAFLCIALITWRLSSGQSGEYIVQRHANLGIDQFTQGNVVAILSFMAFSVFTLVADGYLSLKSYVIQRQLSIVILCFGTVLLVTSIIVSNALLALH
jgi:hypothetical protein